jgi:hypothetical protein
MQSLCRLPACLCIEVTQHSVYCDFFDPDCSMPRQPGQFSWESDFILSPSHQESVFVSGHRKLLPVPTEAGIRRQWASPGISLISLAKRLKRWAGINRFGSHESSRKASICFDMSVCLGLQVQILGPLNSVNRFLHCKVILQLVDTTQLY